MAVRGQYSISKELNDKQKEGERDTVESEIWDSEADEASSDQPGTLCAGGIDRDLSQIEGQNGHHSEAGYDHSTRSHYRES